MITKRALIKRYIALLLLTMFMLVSLYAHPAASQAPEPIQTIVQMGPELGRSVGVFSRMPNGWDTDHSTAVLACGNYYGAWTGEATYVRSYLWFPLPEPPTGYELREAWLEVYYLDDWPFQGSADFGLYRGTAPWDESMDWSSLAPAETAPVTVTHVASAEASGWIRWNATALVAGWLAGETNHGMMLAAVPSPDASPDASGNWAMAAQGRTGDDPILAPRLILWYAPVPTPTPTPRPPDPTSEPPRPTSPPPPQPTATALPVPTPTPMPPPPVILLPMTGALSKAGLSCALLLVGFVLILLGRARR